MNLKGLIVNDYSLLWKEVTPELDTFIKNRNGNDSLTLEDIRLMDSLDNHK